MGIYRSIQINSALWGYAGWLVLVYLHLLHPAAQRQCRMLERLGTTFAKLDPGPGLRRDLLPDENDCRITATDFLFPCLYWPLASASPWQGTNIARGATQEPRNR